MKTTLNNILLAFWKGILVWFWFTFFVFLVWVSYAAFTWFVWLNAVVSEPLTANKWNDLVDAVNDDYSTTETLTNKVWIDWNPIYRKVINISNLTAGSHTITHWLTTFTIVNYAMYTKNSAWIVTWPSWSYFNWSPSYMVNVWPTTINYYLDDNKASWFILIEYTKF